MSIHTCVLLPGSDASAPPTAPCPACAESGESAETTWVDPHDEEYCVLCRRGV